MYHHNSEEARSQLDLELNNLRSALRWSLQEQGDPQIGLAIASAMGYIGMYASCGEKAGSGWSKRWPNPARHFLCVRGPS